MALTQKERSASHYRSRKDNGLCPRCGKPMDREGHYCSSCLEKNRIIVKKIEIFIEKIIYAQSAGKIRFPVRKKSVLNAERKECLGKSH